MIAGMSYPIGVYRTSPAGNIITAIAAALAALALVTGGVEAKPKLQGMHGCTAAQIQAPSASSCLDQLENDIISGAAYPHSLYCDATGVYCCQGDNTRTFNCKKVAITVVKPPLGGITGKPPAKLKANP
jgi:hypothetical protein